MAVINLNKLKLSMCFFSTSPVLGDAFVFSFAFTIVVKNELKIEIIWKTRLY